MTTVHMENGTDGWMSIHGRGSEKLTKNYNQTDWTYYREHNKTRETVDFISNEIKDG